MGDSDVHKAFLCFCNTSKKGSTRASNKTVARIFSDSGLYTNFFTVVDCDIAFTKFTANKTKEMNFIMFKRFLKTLTEKLGRSYEETLKIISQSTPKLHNPTKICENDALKRLFAPTAISNDSNFRKKNDGKKSGKPSVSFEK